MQYIIDHKTITVSGMGIKVIGCATISHWDIKVKKGILLILSFLKVMQNSPTSSSSVYFLPCLAWLRKYPPSS